MFSPIHVNTRLDVKRRERGRSIVVGSTGVRCDVTKTVKKLCVFGVKKITDKAANEFVYATETIEHTHTH